MLQVVAAMLWLLAAPAAGAEPSWKGVIEAQAKKHTWDPHDRRFAAEVVAALGQLETAREHLAFLKRHKIDLKVVPPGDRLPEGAIGSYVDADRSMYINEDELMSGAGELRRLGAAEEDLPAILAWKFLHTVIHEIRHAMTRQRMREKTGLNVRLNPLEGEFISFIDQARVFREAAGSKPNLWSDPSRILEVERTSGRVLQEAGADVEALKRFVTELYEGKPSLLETPREKLVAEYRERKGELLEEAKALLGTDTGAIRDPEIRADLAEYAADVADGILLYKEMLAVLEDKGKHEKLTGFYRRELDALTRALRAPAKPR